MSSILNKDRAFPAISYEPMVTLNAHAPVAQKVADEVVLRRFQGEGVEFFLNRTSLTSFQIF